MNDCIHGLREGKITPHVRFDAQATQGTTLMDALYPPNGGPSPLTEDQLLYIIVQVVYTLECLVRVGIMHLNPTLDRIVLVPEEVDPRRARSYHFVDRYGVARTLYVPFYGWFPRLVGFEDSVKHGFEAIAIAGAIVPLNPKFRGEATAPSLLRADRHFLLGWFVRNMDVYVDTQKFLLELLTARRGGEDWASAPSARPFGEKLLKLLALWTRKDDFSRERFSLRSAVDPRRLLLAAKSAGPRAEEQKDVVYPTMFLGNYPFRILKELDPDEAAKGVLAPRCEHMDLRDQGVSDNCRILTMSAEGGSLAKKEGAEVVRGYDMSGLNAVA